MLRISLAIAAASLCVLAQAEAQAGIVITVDKSTQRLSVNVDGFNRYEFPVSTARIGYRTPNGTYRPQRLAVKYFSRKYDWSPMPHSIFFHGGYAIHGSYEVSHLGSPASHGCIRLHPDNATTLYNLVSGRVAETQIVIAGDAPTMEARSRGDGARAPASFAEIFGSSPGSSRANWRR